MIGREGADLIIDDHKLSHRHAAVPPVPGGIAIRDLGSRNGTGLPKIKIPVLLTYGEHDGLVGSAGGRFEFKHQLTGTRDKTLMIFPGAGHAFFIERQHAKWADRIAGWLASRGL